MTEFAQKGLREALSGFQDLETAGGARALKSCLFLQLYCFGTLGFMLSSQVLSAFPVEAVEGEAAAGVPASPQFLLFQ